jgi:hypothetical protein
MQKRQKDQKTTSRIKPKGQKCFFRMRSSTNARLPRSTPRQMQLMFVERFAHQSDYADRLKDQNQTNDVFVAYVYGLEHMPKKKP